MKTRRTDTKIKNLMATTTILGALGLGAAGTVVAADTLFAKQFARETSHITRLPDMVYDPNLQMMVDPATHRPMYSRAEMLATDDKKKKEKPLPSITCGCKDCPKRDD